LLDTLIALDYLVAQAESLLVVLLAQDRFNVAGDNNLCNLMWLLDDQINDIKAEISFVYNNIATSMLASSRHS